LSLIRPSCGNRFSAMFSPPMTLMRLMMLFCAFFGGSTTRLSTPSTR